MKLQGRIGAHFKAFFTLYKLCRMTFLRMIDCFRDIEREREIKKYDI